MELKKEEPLSKRNFDNKLNKLKSESHGQILKSQKRSWFEYRENMIRGYVRLKALECGIDLGEDHHYSKKEAHNVPTQGPRVTQL